MLKLSVFKGKRLFRSSSISLLTLCVIYLTGCGLQQTAPLQVNQALQPIAINANDSLSNTLKRELQRAGIQVIDTSFSDRPSTETKQAKSQLRLTQITRQKRNYSVSFSGRNAEHLLTLGATIEWQSLNDHDLDQQRLGQQYTQTLIGETRVSDEAIVYTNPANPTAEQSELSKNQQLLERKLSQTIILLINQAATIKTTP